MLSRPLHWLTDLSSPTSQLCICGSNTLFCGWIGPEVSGRMPLEKLFALPPKSHLNGIVEDDVSWEHLIQKKRARLQPLLWDDLFTRRR